MSDRIQSVFCMDSIHTDYAKIASASIASAAINCSEAMDIHIVTVKQDKGESKTIQDISEFVSQYGCELILHEVDVTNLSISPERMSYIGTMLRLLIPNILECDKVIYLDCDLAVNIDLKEMWDLDLQGNSITGSIDEGISDTYNKSQIRKIMGKDTDYLNAGVMVMDLKKIRENHDLFNESIDYLDAHPKAKMRDQDALNCIFIDDKLTIDRKYNRLASSVSKEEGFGDKIIHFTGKKPWKVIRSDVYDEFWRYFLMMPWMSDPQECWRWTKDVVDNRTLAETLGEHGKVVAMTKMFYRAMKLRLLYEIGAKRKQ